MRHAALIDNSALRQQTMMRPTLLRPTPPHVGDPVMLQGTNIAGVIELINVPGSSDRVTLKVTAVLGKSPTSKAMRALRGARVTCPSNLITPRFGGHETNHARGGDLRGRLS